MSENNKTLFINMFCGPGGSKSTVAAGVFFTLKTMNINSEYVSEYAKDLVWAERQGDLRCQPYVTGKQFYRQYRVDGKVDFAVVDSPIILGIAYGGFGATANWQAAALDHFNMFENLNIVLNRNLEDHPYNPKGRLQTQEEAVAKDKEIEDMLIHKNIPSVKMAPMPIQDTIENITQLALYTKYTEPGKSYYGIYYEQAGQKLFTDFTNDKNNLDFLIESAPEDFKMKVQEWLK